MTRFTRQTVAALVALAALAVSACSGSSMSPTGPSGVAPGGSSGTSISGQVNGGSGLSAASWGTNAATTGMITVTVTGTGQTTTTDAQGRFTLTNVPEGTLELRFTGPGINAAVLITVAAGEQVTIAVTVAGSTAVVESQQGLGREAQLEGRITSIDAALGTISVAGVLVSVPETAVIRQGGAVLAFAALQVGDRVHVKGTRDAEGMTAREVRLQSSNTQPPLRLSGVVSMLAGTCPMLAFLVDGAAVETSGGTYFRGITCDTLEDGDRVEVRAHVTAGVWQASEVALEGAGNGRGGGNGRGRGNGRGGADDDDDEEEEEEEEV